MLLGGLVLAATVLAIWVGATAGSTIATIAAALVVPLLVVGFVAGFDRRTLRILMISVVVMGVLGFIIRTLTAGGAGFVGGTVPPAVPPAQGNPQAQTGLALGLLAVVLIASVLGVMLLAGLWLRRKGGEPVDEDEDRVIDRGGELDAPRRRMVRRFARRRPPRSMRSGPTSRCSRRSRAATRSRGPRARPRPSTRAACGKPATARSRSTSSRPTWASSGSRA